VVAAAGFQNSTDASAQGAPVAAKPRAIAHVPISLSPNPCASAGGGAAAIATSAIKPNEQRSSLISLLLRCWPGRRRAANAAKTYGGGARLSGDNPPA
jgi:hypothetical protein